MTRIKHSFWLFCLLPAATAFAQASLEEARESMLQNSPFQKWEAPKPVVQPPPPPVAPAGALSREIVFKGAMRIGEEQYFNVFDKVENRSMLLGLNDNSRGARFSVVDFSDSGDPSITLQAGNGNREKIYLAKTDGKSIPTASAAPINRPLPPELRPNPAPTTSRAASTVNTERRRRVIPRRINTNNGQ
ncbi:hypothetical protein [Cerasicoccus fimbriatus]|uniref:hypothetical protein n=1 Tax=Cerasicoccus fimbriatus TaxID=3014554 RepID=UPI0022B56050|nr:hypothetical protein [Cerasicoccus sp. TK19100]